MNSLPKLPESEPEKLRKGWRSGALLAMARFNPLVSGLVTAIIFRQLSLLATF